MGAKMPATYWRAYRARRRADGNPVRRRAGYVRDRSNERKHPLGRPRAIHFPTDVEVPRFDPHPLVSEAIAHLTGIERHEVAGVYDSRVGDLIGEYVLASLEGNDPAAAMDAYRRARRFEDAVLIHGWDW